MKTEPLHLINHEQHLKNPYDSVRLSFEGETYIVRFQKPLDKITPILKEYKENQ